jgi:hypothetical protein
LMLERLAGKVSYRPPGARRALPLTEPAAVPVGTRVDASRGRVAVTAAKTKGVASAKAGGGAFKVTQARTGIVSLSLTGGKTKRCGSARRSLRKLDLSAPALFRVLGRRSVATPGGTAAFTTNELCQGTRTRVSRGRVTVRDLKERRTIKLRKGRSYLARA